MKHAITKDELVWVIVRLIGVFFLWQSVKKGGTLLGVYHSSSSAGMSISPKMVKLATEPLIFSIVIYSLLAVYFLVRGGFFVWLLSRAVSVGKVVPAGPAGPDGFDVWLAQDATRRSFSRREQLAMFEKWRLENY